MSVKQETVADISAKMHNEGRTGDSSCLEWIGTKMRDYADRIDAAYKRELGDYVKLREAVVILHNAIVEIRDDILDMVMNGKSENPDSYTHRLLLSIGGACDIALNNTNVVPHSEDTKKEQ